MLYDRAGSDPMLMPRVPAAVRGRSKQHHRVLEEPELHPELSDVTRYKIVDSYTSDDYFRAAG